VSPIRHRDRPSRLDLLRRKEASSCDGRQSSSSSSPSSLAHSRYRLVRTRSSRGDRSSGRLPAGGIAVASGTTFYLGSIPSGAIVCGDVRTGVSFAVPGAAGRSAIGLKVDAHGRLFVAGGDTGKAFVHEADSGAEIASYQLASGNTFVNDVVIARDGAYFADSFSPFPYGIPIGSDGSLGPAADTITLTGQIDLGARIQRKWNRRNPRRPDADHRAGQYWRALYGRPSQAESRTRYHSTSWC
jgi:hypothetical protein